MQGQKGQGLTEYALLIALVSVVVIGALLLFGPALQEAYDSAFATPAPTAEPTPTPTPGPQSFSCTVPLAWKVGPGHGNYTQEFTCKLGVEFESVETLTVTVLPPFADYHLVQLRFATPRITFYYCGPGGCRGIGGPAWDYPNFDWTDTFPDPDYRNVRDWATGPYSGLAYYRELDKSFKTKHPSQSWSGTLEIVVTGMPRQSGGQ